MEGRLLRGVHSIEKLSSFSRVLFGIVTRSIGTSVEQYGWWIGRHCSRQLEGSQVDDLMEGGKGS